MSEQPLRFLHASDFRLDEPLSGLIDPPDELIDLLADAPYFAASQVFDTALVEDVDFVVLSGNLIDVFRSGPRGLVFLWEQFRRLSERDVAVYWAASERDQPEQWPAGFELPANVHVFPSNKVEEVSHFRDDRPIATLLGRSGGGRGILRAADFQGDQDQVTIAAATGPVESKSLAQQRVDYWALGGQATRETLFAKPRCAHFPGSPQGRCPEHAGAHGCTIARIDRGGRITLQPVATDAVRWTTAHLEAPREGTIEALERVLDDQTRRLGVESDRPLLVTWQISGAERLRAGGRDGLWRDELAARLRKKHGSAASPVWTVSVEPELPADPPATWLDEHTLLGDYLRELREYEFLDAEERPLRERLGELGLIGELPETCDLLDRIEQQRVLREAGKLGADLLRGKA